VLFGATIILPVTSAPVARADTVAGYNLTALSAGVRYQLNSPGLLPVGDPAEGNVMELDVPIARTSIGQGPVINAMASPAYPGDTAAHVGTALTTFGVPIPIPNYPILAESNYPPTPDKPGHTSFSQNGVGSGSSDAGPDGAKVLANTVSQTIGGVVQVDSSSASNELSITGDKVKSTATAVAGNIIVSNLVQIGSVIGVAEATSDGAKGTPKASLQIGSVTVAGQAAYIDGDGVHVATTPLLAPGLTAGIQQMVNKALSTDGVVIRAVAPTTKPNGAAAGADSGALVITIERVVPALGIPGVPAINIPGVPAVALGTPDLPTHIEIAFGTAKVGVNATAVPTYGVDLPAIAPIDISGDSTFAAGDLSGITGPGASLEGALTAPAQSGDAQLGFRPTAGQTTGKGIPIGWVIVGIFATFALSGPLLGYARWQLLEGRHR
jgi:hypothetical protein